MRLTHLLLLILIAMMGIALWRLWQIKPKADVITIQAVVQRDSMPVKFEIPPYMKGKR